MSSDNHPEKVCPFLDQRCSIGEASSSPLKRSPLHSSQSPLKTISQRPKDSLARLSALGHPLNWAPAGSQIALLSPSRRLKIQGALI
jgi:hypothetical protein